MCGHARNIRFQAEEIAAKYPGDQITDDEGHWFIGDLALTQLPPGELLRLRGRTANETTIGHVFRRRLAKAVIGKLTAGYFDGRVIHVRLAVGLPVAHMGDAGGVRSALLGQHRVRTNTTDVIANVMEVMVMPQPYGALYRALLTPEGDINRTHTYFRTGVCDVGTYTVDLALDDNGEFVDAESGSVEGGVYLAQERISDLLEQRYRQKMPFKLVEQILRTGTFRAYGQIVEMQAEVEEALAPLKSATLNLMNEKWKSGTTVEVIYLVGGGAELVHEEVEAAYPQVVRVHEAQFANARGYLQYALFKAKA